MLARVCHYLTSVSSEKLSPASAALHLANIHACLPAIQRILINLAALYQAWHSRGGLDQTLAGFRTWALRSVPDSKLKASSNAFIRSLASVARVNRPTSSAEMQATCDLMDLYLGRWDLLPSRWDLLPDGWYVARQAPPPLDAAPQYWAAPAGFRLVVLSILAVSHISRITIVSPTQHDTLGSCPAHHLP
jgi:hypothetical protein